MLVNGYVVSRSFVFGWIKLTPFLLIAINNCSGKVGSDVCYNKNKKIFIL